MQGSLQYPKVF